MATATHPTPLEKQTIVVRCEPWSDNKIIRYGLLTNNIIRYEIVNFGSLFRHILKAISIILKSNCDEPEPEELPRTANFTFKDLQEWNQAFNTEQYPLDDLLSEYGGTGLKHMIQIPYLMISDYSSHYYKKLPETRCEEFQRLIEDSDATLSDCFKNDGSYSYSYAAEDEAVIDGLRPALYLKYKEMSDMFDLKLNRKSNTGDQPDDLEDSISDTFAWEALFKFTVGHLKALEPILNRCKAKKAAREQKAAKPPASDDEALSQQAELRGGCNDDERTGGGI
ncbi:hypothetical protein FPQ18DRAFT_395211 [Pyronema domesticum]|nr:hypothetical protein FPQ18DRAFT_395211 [Pyronema domesticum]